MYSVIFLQKHAQCFFNWPNICHCKLFVHLFGACNIDVYCGHIDLVTSYFLSNYTKLLHLSASTLFEVHWLCPQILGGIDRLPVFLISQQHSVLEHQEAER